MWCLETLLNVNTAIIADTTGLRSTATPCLSLLKVVCRRRRCLPVALFVAALLAGVARAQPLVSTPLYHAYDLGNLGGSSAVPWAINAEGDIVGSATPASGGLNHPFLYTHGQMLDLGTLGGAYGFAQSINNLGQVTGYAQGPNGNPRAFLYSNGSMSFLGGPLSVMSYGYGINDHGLIAGGYYPSTSGPERAFLYENGRAADLGTLGSPWAEASGINNLGQVTGYSQNAGGSFRAFIYSNGRMTDLGALATDSWGTAINDLGQVVGYANVSSPAQQHAFLWTSGHMIDLGSPYGPFNESLALGINNAGQVVGWYSSGNEHAFLYSGGQMFDLDSLLDTPTGTFFLAAYGINDSGQIAARGADNHIYLVTPVPEPASGALLVVGFALGIYSRRHRKLRTVA